MKSPYNLILTHIRAIRNMLDKEHDKLNRNVNSFASPRINNMRKLLADMEEENQWLQHCMEKKDKP